MINSHRVIFHSITILLWNANGQIIIIIRQKKKELKALITEKNIDIILISEVHLTPHYTFRIPDYRTHYYDQPDGTALASSVIILKSNINHTVLLQFQTSFLQAINISLLLYHILFTIFTAYCPPGQANIITTENFNLYFQSLGNMFLSEGDFNSKHQSWGSRITNTRGRSLYNSVLRNRLKHIFPPRSTYWPTHINRTPNLLD